MAIIINVVESHLIQIQYWKTILLLELVWLELSYLHYLLFRMLMK
jgi:hypothetical protein